MLSLSIVKEYLSGDHTIRIRFSMCRSISLVVHLVLVFTSQKFYSAFPSGYSTIAIDTRRTGYGLLFSSNVRDDRGTVGLGIEHPQLNKTTNNVAVGGVTLKMAFDSSPVWGVADLSETKSERFTSPSSLDLVHRLRRVSDCVLVGKGTVERDNCTLTVRRVPLTEERPYHPIRVVLDPALTLWNNGSSTSEQGKYEIFHDGLATLVYFSPSSVSIDAINAVTKGFQIEQGREKTSERVWRKDNITLVSITELPQEGASSTLGSKRYISPKQIVHDLMKRGIRHIMVEGGEFTIQSVYPVWTSSKPIASHSGCSYNYYNFLF